MSLPVGVPAAAPAQPKRGLPGCLIALLVFGGIMAAFMAVCVAFFLAKGGSIRSQPLHINQDSMCPTLCADEYVLTDSNAYLFQPPQRGSLILFEHGTSAGLWVRRVIGVAGDTVSSDDGGNVSVNGERVIIPPPCGSPLPRNQDPGVRMYFDPVVVPAGHVFVISDKLWAMADSRVEKFGTVKLEDVHGKPTMIYISPFKGRFGCLLR
jgi:signal peptidase I